MRIVAGEVRGRRVTAPQGADIRPSSERVREAMFNSLYSRDAISNAQVLDLFAGSGALGFEALSRGASHVTFVDNDRRSLDAVRLNLKRLQLSAKSTIVAADAQAYLLHRFGTQCEFGATSILDEVPRTLADPVPRGFDLVFVDPPYSFDDWPTLLGLLRWINGATLVIESDREIEFASGWRIHRCKRYGSTVVTFATFDAGS